MWINQQKGHISLELLSKLPWHLSSVCSCPNALRMSFVSILLASLSGATSISCCQCRRCKRCGFDPWVRKIHWRRKCQPTPVFLPGEFHGQRSLTVKSPWGPKESDMTDCMHILYQRQFWLLQNIMSLPTFCGRRKTLFLLSILCSPKTLLKKGTFLCSQPFLLSLVALLAFLRSLPLTLQSIPYPPWRGILLNVLYVIKVPCFLFLGSGAGLVSTLLPISHEKKVVIMKGKIP